MATDDRPPQNVTYLDEIREPGEGWAQQDRFLRLIETIDDEDDYLVVCQNSADLNCKQYHGLGWHYRKSSESSSGQEIHVGSAHRDTPADREQG
ncbi:MAG: hypothetical protein IH973_14640 [Myxococcales bacterium]|nr:hypothetical protein [Myxococcales bacterium]